MKPDDRYNEKHPRHAELSLDCCLYNLHIGTRLIAPDGIAVYISQRYTGSNSREQFILTREDNGLDYCRAEAGEIINSCRHRKEAK